MQKLVSLISFGYLLPSVVHLLTQFSKLKFCFILVRYLKMKTETKKKKSRKGLRKFNDGKISFIFQRLIEERMETSGEGKRCKKLSTIYGLIKERKIGKY